MTSPVKLLFASPLLLAFACGDLKSPTAAVGHVSYKSNGDIAAFLPRDLVTMDGRLAVEKERVPLVGPPAGANIAYQSLSADGGVAAIAWAPNEEVSDYRVDVFRVSDRTSLLSVPSINQLVGLQLSPAGDLLAVRGKPADSGVTDGVHVYEIDGGARLWTDGSLSNQFVFSPDGTRLYGTVGGSELGSWDARTGDVLMRVSPPAAPPQDLYGMLQLAVSPDGQRLLVELPRASNDTSDYGWFRTSDLSLESIVSQAPNYDMVSALAVSADGQRFATIAHRTDVTPMPGQAGIPPRIQMWTSSGSLLYAIDTPFIGQLGFSPDGSALVATPYPDPDSPGVSLFRVSDGGLIASHTFSTNPL